MLSLASDWKIIDDPRTITISSKISEGVYDNPVTVEYAQPIRITSLDKITGPLFANESTRAWNVWAEKLGGLIPKKGDALGEVSGELTGEPTGVPSTNNFWTVVRVDYVDTDGGGVQRYRLWVEDSV